ncbi:uncharacterized protein LOC119085412 isoform X1 [Bradysia coprophila]|uniref:uncharacterized protein LOC119085412 isoform X1 n=1 Tax=Bradysia coprophila TaxID=38358 RepID=UPI00187D9882|nr:uncharacterized protein LOC119085412 isoform X1 [Bradysia coprophila]
MDSASAYMSEMSTPDPDEVLDNGLLSEHPTLNDYCWLMIFKHLSIGDLANFRASFKDLATVTDMEFNKVTHGSLLFGFDDNENMIEVIKQFGHLIKDLCFDYDKLRGITWKEIFTAMGENCNDNLKKLSLGGRSLLFMKKEDILPIENILKNIETLEFDNDDDSRHRFPKHYLHILSHCEKLRELTVIGVIDINLHKTLFENNRNLLKLKWFGPKDSSALKNIVDNLMHTRLEEFAISFMHMTPFMRNFSEFLRLSHLKRLSIDCKFVDLTDFLSDIDTVDNSLTLLTLSFARLDHKNIGTLGRIKRLKVIKLCDDCIMATTSYIISLQILCGNRNVEHLLIFCCDKIGAIDETNFLKIVDIRKRIGAENCLHLTLSRDIYNTSLKAIPSELLEANKDVLKLIDEYDSDYEYNDLDDF